MSARFCDDPAGPSGASQVESSPLTGNVGCRRGRINRRSPGYRVFMATKKKAPAVKTAVKKAATSARSAPTKTSSRRKSSADSAARDAIAILKDDHRRVSDLFEKFDGLGDRAHKTRESTVRKIVEELSIHAGIEEEVFYPALRERFDANGDGQVLEALEEHHVVKLLLVELESMPSTSERYTAKVTVLNEIVDHHVEEEEDELFKMVRDRFTRTELIELGAELTAARTSVPTRPHPEAPDTPPGNLVANVIAAPLDAATAVTKRAATAVRDLID